MSRSDLAYAVYEFFRCQSEITIEDAEIWRAIAQTDDVSLLTFYEDIVLRGGDLDG